MELQTDASKAVLYDNTPSPLPMLAPGQRHDFLIKVCALPVVLLTICYHPAAAAELQKEETKLQQQVAGGENA